MSAHDAQSTNVEITIDLYYDDGLTGVDDLLFPLDTYTTNRVDIVYNLKEVEKR